MAYPRQNPAEAAGERAAHLREVGAGGSSVAADLATARLRYGVDLVDVAENLRIRYDHLRALEEGRFDDLPGPTYVVGFLRSYATYLGLDAEEMVQRFKAEVAGFSAQQKLHFPSPADEGRVPTGALLLTALLIAGGAYAGWYYMTSADRVAVNQVPEVPPQLAEKVPAPADENATAPAEPVSVVTAVASVPPPEDRVAAVNPAAGSSSAPAESASLQASTVPAPSPTVGDEVTRPEPVGERPSEPASGETGVSAPAHSGETPAVAIEVEPDGDTAVGPQTVSLEHEPLNVSDTASNEEADRAGAEGEASVSAAAIAPALPTISAPPTRTAPAEASRGVTGSEDSAEPAVRLEGGPQTTDVALAAVAPARPTVSLSATRGPSTAASGRSAGSEGSAEPAVTPETDSPTPGVAVTAAVAPVVPPPVTESSTYVPRVFGQAHVNSRIQVRARQEAWVQVTGIDSELLITRILRPGDVYNVPDRPGLKLMTGNAGGLEITVDGVVVPPLGAVGTVRRDVALNPAKLRAGEPGDP